MSAGARYPLAKRATSALGALSPWLGLGLLWLMFELPSAVKPGNLEPGAIRPTLDVLALLTLWGASFALSRAGRSVRIALGVVAGILFAFRLDVMVFTQLMRDDPLLYDQWFMVRHLFVLIGDLMSWKTFAVVGGFIATVWLMVFLSGRLLRHARRLFEPGERTRTFTVLAATWLLILAAYQFSSQDRTPLVRLLAPSLVHNVRESVSTYVSIQHGVAHSPYAAFSNIALHDKPDVLLFIVESYGRMLSTHEDTRDRHAILLDQLEAQLTESGWNSVSAFATASVSGGRSWLAEGTMLMGTPIRYEAVFQHLVARPGRVPNFVEFLDRNGYRTVLLTPADRERPGIHAVKRYPFDQVLDLPQMGYRGPSMGWGIVPDQYALDVAQKRVLDVAGRREPVFLDFHMVSSHAPWSAVPPLLENVKELDTLRGNFDTTPPDPTTLKSVLWPLSLYARDEDHVHPWMNHLTEPMRRGYQATISYDLRVITRYLRERKDDALVIVLGDHQPPVITRANASFDTPVHVLSRDASRLAEFVKQGFVSGLSIPDDAKPALAHAGLFSLFVRSLAAHDGSASPPPVLREGFALLDAP